MRQRQCWSTANWKTRTGRPYLIMLALPFISIKVKVPFRWEPQIARQPQTDHLPNGAANRPRQAPGYASASPAWRVRRGGPDLTKPEMRSPPDSLMTGCCSAGVKLNSATMLMSQKFHSRTSAYLNSCSPSFDRNFQRYLQKRHRFLGQQNHPELYSANRS